MVAQCPPPPSACGRGGSGFQSATHIGDFSVSRQVIGTRMGNYWGVTLRIKRGFGLLECGSCVFGEPCFDPDEPCPPPHTSFPGPGT